MDISSDAYKNEPVRYPALKVVDLREEGAKIAESYRNMVINRVNGSCLRLAVFDGDYVWHYHPKSDELFIVDDSSTDDSCAIAEQMGVRVIRHEKAIFEIGDRLR